MFARVICGYPFESLLEQTDLLKLYTRQAKIKNDEGFVYVIFDTTNPQNRALHDVLHI